MQPYIERAARVAAGSSVAVEILLSAENDDIEIVMLRPQAASYVSREEFIARRLRPVGVCGLQGLRPVCAFREPLDPSTVDAIAGAFLTYVRSLMQAATPANAYTDDSTAWCERLYALEDPRPC